MSKNNTDEKFVPDSRFKALGKDAIIVAIGWCIFFCLMMSIAYIWGKGDPKEYTYLMGFPLWFTLSVIVQLLFMGLTIFMLAKRFSDISLEPDDPDYNYEEDR